jgi:hypothetical protein
LFLPCFLVVIPEGDLLLFLSLLVPAVVCSCRHPERNEGPGTLRTAHTDRTFPPAPRVPHLRDGLIVAKVGIEQSETAFNPPPAIIEAAHK